ncbi:MAG: type II toxin-antitoxin system VapC family toxin [Chthoniobacterales bacterium]
MALILDTSFIVDAEREAQRRPDGRAHDFLSSHPEEEFFITFTVAGELACGTSAAARESWERLLRPYALLMWNREISFLYGRIYRDLSSAGTLIGTNDLWIAATALRHKMAVVTDNMKEFSRVTGLQVVSY